MGCCDHKSVIRAACRVCQLSNSDSSVKRVKYCKLCGVYLCEEHRGLSVARVIAIVKQIFN